MAIAGHYGTATSGEHGIPISKDKSESGKNGISVARGCDVKVRGGMNTLLIIVEEYDNGCEIKDWKTAVVDGGNTAFT